MSDKDRLHIYDGSNFRESAWCEFVEGDRFRVLNDCIYDVIVDLPSDHPAAINNGRMCAPRYGMIVETIPDVAGGRKAVRIVDGPAS